MLSRILRSRNWNCYVNSTHLQPLYFSTSSIQIKPSFCSYLVGSLGFTDQQSLSTSSKLARWWQTDKTDGDKKVSNFEFAKNADSVVDCFKNHGFSDTQIRNIVSHDPRILINNVEKTLIPKFRALQDHGFSCSDIADIFSMNAGLLRRRMDSTTLPLIRTVSQLLGLKGDEVVSCMKRFHYQVIGKDAKNLEMNLALLGCYGVPFESIRKRVMKHPSPFFAKPETFKVAVIRAEVKLGIPRHSKWFLSAIQVLIENTDETVNIKFETFKSFGWTESDVIGLCRRNPCFLGMSVFGIKKKLGFLMKELGYKAEYLVTHPALLSYSMETRIEPRRAILQVLRMKGLIREDYHLYSAVCLTEISFVKRFVLPFKETHELYSELNGCPLRLPTENLEKGDCKGV